MPSRGLTKARGAVLLLVLAGLVGLSPALFARPLSLGVDFPYTVLKDPTGRLDLPGALQALSRERHSSSTTFSRGYARAAFWLRFRLPARLFDDGERWLQLGPNFVDDIRLFYRPAGGHGPWRERRTGDRYPGPRGDLDYRFPVFVMPPPDAGEKGYEVVVRVASSSAVMLQLNLWQPREFLENAAASSGFWSFYFGLATISGFLALVLAIILKSRLLWSVAAMSVAYVLVACVQGYIGWLLPAGVPLQHYLTGIMTLLSYALLLWLSTEALNLRRRLPWAHRFLMAACVLIAFLPLSIPLDLYGLAIRIQSIIYLVTATLFIGACLYLWYRDRFRLSTVLLGASPLVCIIASLCGLFSVFGWIPFHADVYVIWQYALMVNILLVMAIAVFRIRRKHLQEQDNERLAHELRVEREASFHQRQFMGMVSHEFRTPLAVISASLQNLSHLRDPDPARARRYRKIERATDRLIQLTDNCLADARLAADTLYLRRVTIELVALLRSAASLVELSDHHRLRLTIEGRELEPTEAGNYPVSVDPALMRIALSNVIDNAVKYSRAGTVDIGVVSPEQRLEIRIGDQGPGIAEDQVAVIFDRYRRADQSDREQRGVGLGLYVSRQIARAHGGELSLLDNTAGGCRFVFTLPTNQGNTGV